MIVNKQITNITSNNKTNFDIKTSDTGELLSLRHKDDKYEMNWVEGEKSWGSVKVKSYHELDVSLTRSFTKENNLKETFTFKNNTDYDIFTQLGEIAIYTTFNDSYESAEICMTQRCHAHIWCGKQVSYIMGLRMGGEAPHLGLILTKGSIEHYSIERDTKEISNDRGDILLHPKPFTLLPGESYTIEWELFWHNGKVDFYNKLKKYNHYIHVQSDKYVLFENENNQITIKHPFSKIDELVIKCNNQLLLTNDNYQTSNDINRKNKDNIIQLQDHLVTINHTLSEAGNYDYEISMNGIQTKCSILVMPDLRKLVQKRCEFIIKHQQYHNENSQLNGAYLVFDNEVEQVYYSHYHDHNGGRERFGMGALLAKFLQLEPSQQMEESLLLYLEYVERELFDEATGTVFNDINRNNDIHRLYNYPWLAVLFFESYKLLKEEKYLVYVKKILKAYYKNGGAKFYPIEFPLYNMLTLLKEKGYTKDVEIIMEQVSAHVNFISTCGTNYPPSEVNYEQSIVAPAANVLLEVYLLTKDLVYLEEAKKHIKILELFNGQQPDYHLYEVAIRHWDGYWFGKKRLYGDTFPHYWSALTGRVYKAYAEITGDKKYITLSDHSMRGVLSLFEENGRASCAHVFPFKVNDIKGSYNDPWANDQDWGLYFWLDELFNNKLK